MSRRAAASLVGLNSCERIRPERPRNAIQRLVWLSGNSQQRVGFISTCDDEGSNPRMALRRLLRLYEGRQYREAANFLLRLPQYTLRSALPDIPLDLLIETLPHSIALLEALYARLLELGIRDAKVLRLEQLLWKVVGILAGLRPDDQFQFRAWARLLSALNRAAPSARSALITKRRALERTIDGLGRHGLVAVKLHNPGNTTTESNNSNNNNSNSSISSTTNLVPLRLALKEELESRSEAYKLALHKIESLGKHAGLHKGDQQGLQAASHQRQLSLKYSEVQQRLIDNQSLLNTLERTRSCQLDTLLTELKRRVEQDKEALRQWQGLRRSDGPTALLRQNLDPKSSLAAGLLHYSRGCAIALKLMSADADLDLNNFNSTEYHQQAHDEYDYNEDEVVREEEGEESSSSAGYHTDESCSPTPEPNGLSNRDNLFQGLQSTNVTIERLRERYAALYSHAQLQTLEALDNLDALRDTPELKARILYSVVVLSWRLSGILQASRRIEALKILNGGNTLSQPTVPNDFEDCIRRQLATVGAQSGAREVAQQVIGQLERTLCHYPCLRNNQELKKYALECSRLAWACLARAKPLVLDAVQGVEFRYELHARHPASNKPNGNRVQAVLWPGLREGYQGVCLHRALVLT